MERVNIRKWIFILAKLYYTFLRENHLYRLYFTRKIIRWTTKVFPQTPKQVFADHQHFFFFCEPPVCIPRFLVPLLYGYRYRQNGIFRHFPRKTFCDIRVDKFYGDRQRKFYTVLLLLFGTIIFIIMMGVHTTHF